VSRYDIVTTALEIAVITLTIGALIVAAVILGSPWCMPVGMLTAAILLAVIRLILAIHDGDVAR
jgi:hypothetical protein